MQNTELEEFAKWFHQDFGVLFESIELGAETYLNTLQPERKKILISEIRQLLVDYPGKSNKGLKNAWLRLGAQWWDREKSPLLLKGMVSN